MSDTVMGWLFGGGLFGRDDQRSETSRHGSSPTSSVPDRNEDAGEQALLAQLNAGSPDAFDMLYRRTYRDLYQFAYSFVRNRDVAEEVVQDVFTSLLVSLSSTPITRTVRGYLFGAVRRRAYNVMRHQRVVDATAARETLRQETLALDSSGHELSEQVSDERLDLEVRLRALDAAMQRLSERQREAVTLRVQHQLSYPELAEALGVSADAARMLVNRAEATLRRLLEPLFRE